MAIARAASAQLGTSGSANDLTAAFDVGAGTDRVLLVFIETEGSTTQDATATYNSVAMHKAIAQVQSDDNAHIIYGFYLQAPTTGSNDVFIDFGSGTYYGGAWAMAYTGAAQDATPLTSGGNHPAGSNTSTSTNIDTTGTDNAWIAGFGRIDNGGDFSATGAFTLLSAVGGFGDTGNATADTNGPISPGASTAVGFSRTVAGGAGMAAIAIAPAGGGGATTNFLSLLGVGT